jgi:D-glycero-alpha-D-manno-heptose-7-phosphate kinase
LESRLILSFAGAPRFSGATNWDIIKGYVEGATATVEAMGRIKQVAHTVREAVIARDWDGLAAALALEWENRRSLAEGVTNERVEAMMEAALDAGALANKLCGAGGGGCMISFVEPTSRDVVEAALAAAGAEVLPLKIVVDGIKIERLP